MYLVLNLAARKKTYENLEKVLTFVNKKGYNEYNNRDTLIVSCPNQMLAATLFAGYKCIGGQMLIKIYLFGGGFFVGNEMNVIKWISFCYEKI